jgi:1,4-alpha-glucan branching enzyme
MYFYNEKFMLPLSHDEIVHGKSPMIYKMPGDEWQKFANLRVLYTYMFTHPGAKLLFMGNEFAQTTEWNYKTELDWGLLDFECHIKMQQLIKDLNQLYKSTPALHDLQFNSQGFEWIDLNHREQGIIVYMRKGKKLKENLLIVLNTTPVVQNDWKVVVSGKSAWKEIFNSDQEKYWGTGDVYNPHPKIRVIDKKLGKYELNLHIPALAALIFQ